MARKLVAHLACSALTLSAVAWTVSAQAQNNSESKGTSAAQTCDATPVRSCQTRRMFSRGSLWETVKDGTACNDGNVCDGLSTCYAGQCLAPGAGISADNFAEESAALLPVLPASSASSALESLPTLSLSESLPERPTLASLAALASTSCTAQPLGPPLLNGSNWWYGITFGGQYYVTVGLAAANDTVSVLGTVAQNKIDANGDTIDDQNSQADNGSDDLLIALWQVTPPVSSTQFCDQGRLRAVRRLGMPDSSERPASISPRVRGTTLTVFIDSRNGFTLDNTPVCAGGRGIAGLDFDLTRAPQDILNPIAGVSLPFCGKVNSSAYVEYVADGDDFSVYTGHTNVGLGREATLFFDTGSTRIVSPRGQSDSTFVAALDAQYGSLRWLTVLPTTTPEGTFPPNENHPAAVIRDAAGNVLVAGTFLGNIDFGRGPVTSRGESDVYLAKFSPRGELLLARTFGGAGADSAGLPCPEDPGFDPCRLPIPKALSIDPNDGAVVLRGVTDGDWSIRAGEPLDPGNFELRLSPGAPAPSCAVDDPCLAASCDPNEGCFTIPLDGPACTLRRGGAGTCARGRCQASAGMCG